MSYYPNHSSQPAYEKLMAGIQKATPKATGATRKFDAGIRDLCEVKSCREFSETRHSIKPPKRYLVENRKEGRTLVYGEGTYHGDVVHTDWFAEHVIVWVTGSHDPISIERPVLYLTDSSDE